MIELKAGERLDDLQRNGCRIIQNEKLFCFGMDAVLLTAFTQEDLREGDNILDLCSGNGVIPILLDARCGGGHMFTALEINPVCVDMARRTVATAESFANGMAKLEMHRCATGVYVAVVRLKSGKTVCRKFVHWQH